MEETNDLEGLRVSLIYWAHVIVKAHDELTVWESKRCSTKYDAKKPFSVPHFLVPAFESDSVIQHGHIHTSQTGLDISVIDKSSRCIHWVCNGLAQIFSLSNPFLVVTMPISHNGCLFIWNFCIARIWKYGCSIGNFQVTMLWKGIYHWSVFTIHFLFRSFTNQVNIPSHSHLTPINSLIISRIPTPEAHPITEKGRKGKKKNHPYKPKAIPKTLVQFSRFS